MARVLFHDAIYARPGPLWNRLGRGAKDARLGPATSSPFFSYVQQDSKTEKALGRRSNLDRAKEFFTGANDAMSYKRMMKIRIYSSVTGDITPHNPTFIASKCNNKFDTR